MYSLLIFKPNIFINKKVSYLSIFSKYGILR